MVEYKDYYARGYQSLFKIIGRFIGSIVIEIVFEMLIRGTGYIITDLFIKNEPDPDGLIVIIVGSIFWLIVGYLSYLIFRQF